MKRTIALAALFLGALPSTSHAQSANADIFLASIRRIGDSIVVDRPVNVTHRPGYDNQPAFAPDSRSILYTAQRDGQTDIWRYDLATRTRTQLTRTPESEYSATPMPGEARFSVVRVESDSSQRLWSFANDGSDPQLLLAKLTPVGYHAWLSPTTLVAYVLGAPSTLHLIERDGSPDLIVARNVGRAVVAVPVGLKALFSFTQKGDGDKAGIFVYSGRIDTTRFVHRTVVIDTSRRATRVSRTQTVVDSVVIAGQTPYLLVEAAPDNEFHAWTPDGVLLTASSSVLLRWSGALDAGSRWIPVADLRRYGVKNVSRLAVSPDGKWLSFVAEPAR
jgi:hypothetical protein